MFYALAPIFYHVSADSTLVFAAFILLEFVDGYSTYIMVLLFGTGLLTLKNQLLKFSSFSGTSSTNLYPALLTHSFNLLRRVARFFKFSRK